MMQLAWLDEMTKQGSISAAERDFIYADCRALVGEGMNKSAATEAQIVDAVEKNLTTALMVLGPPLIGSFLAWNDRRRYKAEDRKNQAATKADVVKDLADTKAKLLSHPDFAGHSDKVEARFSEIARIAPTVARNGELMQRLMKQKLHSGLTNQDAVNLTMIQASYTPDFKVQKEHAKLAAEAAGELVADTLALLKEAGIVKEAGPTMRMMGQTLLNTATMATVPLLLSVGAASVAAAADWRTSKTRQKQLAQSFATAMDPNHPGTETLRANPEQAREAFHTLVHFSPSVALDPNSARSFMNKHVAGDPHRLGAYHPSEIKDLADIEGKLRGAGGGSTFFRALTGSLSATGFSDAIKGGLAPYREMASHDLESQIAAGKGLEVSKGRYAPLGAAKEEERKREETRIKKDEQSDEYHELRMEKLRNS